MTTTLFNLPSTMLPSTILRPLSIRQVYLYACTLRSARSLHTAPLHRLPPSSAISVVAKASASSSSSTPSPSPSPISQQNTGGGDEQQQNAFSYLGLSEETTAAVTEKGLTTPTDIQSSAIPALLRDRKSDYMIASHTGSGKTLAYLLPIVHILKEHEVVFGVPAKPRRPRALILGPTRELAEQIHAVAKSIAHNAKFRSGLVTGAGDMGLQKASLNRPVDVLIGTPGRVQQHAERGNVYYGDVEIVVLDEADTMLDRGFGVEVQAVLKAVRSKPIPARVVLVSATMTKQVRRLVNENFPSIRTVETDTLHKGVAGAKHVFLPISGGTDKLDALCQVIEGEIARGKRIMVFSNTLDSCRATEHRLREEGIATVCYHGDIPLADRKTAISQFSSPEAVPPPVLVATDLAARGLDIPGRVDHVVNFDFPLNSVDYLHRTGRTARAGASGKITSLVGKGDRVLAERVEEALTKGLSLDGISADRAVLPPHMRPKPETYARRAAERKAEKHYGSGGGGTGKSGRSSSGGGGRTSSSGGGGRTSGSSGGGRTNTSSRTSGGGSGRASGSSTSNRSGGTKSFSKGKTFTKFK